MAVFIELQEDPFLQAFDDEEARSKDNQLQARRPMRGIQLRKETVAYMTILDSKGKNIPLIDQAGVPSEKLPGKGETNRYTNFMVKGYQVQRQEKQQLMQTFGEDYIFFFGEQPKVYNIQGILMHTADFNWRNEFVYNYENHLRGTKLAEAGARLYLYQSGILWEGYPLSFNYNEMPSQPYHVEFSFRILVTGETIIDNVGDTLFPTKNYQEYYASEWSFPAILQGYEDSRSVLPERANFIADLAAYIETGTFGREQTFIRDKPLRGKVSDNVDEILGGPALNITYNPVELAKVKRKLGIREAVYLWKEQYLRLKFILDSGRRLTTGEQTIAARAFGVFFMFDSLARATMPVIRG